MFLLYNLLITFTAILWVPWMLWRTRQRSEGPNWKERQGNYDLEPRKDRKRIWIHAVSVGEVMAALPILRETRQLLPDHEILLSVTTSSGHRTAREHAVELYDHLVYFPIDVARFQLSAIQRVQPAVVAIMETELWFNFLWAAKVFECKTLIINGRISDRSFRRSLKVKFFYSRLLKEVDQCLMQSERDAERIRALGAANVAVLGNSKFDQAAEGLDTDSEEWRRSLGLEPGRPVIVIGSTRGEDEERFVLEALGRVQGLGVQVIHAPRHVERAATIAEAARKQFPSVGLRSERQTGDYLVLDTYGELGKVYSVADVVIIGGGFADHGGQNLLQPLAHGKPVLHGRHMQNFRDVAESARAAGASRVCETPAELASALEEILQDESLRERMSVAARELIHTSVGASRRYAEAIAAAAAEFRP